MSGARTLAVRNPVTGVADHVLALPDAAALGARVAAARAAQPRWAALPMAARVDALRALADAVERRRLPIIDALAADTGRLALSRLEVDNFRLRLEHELRSALAVEAWSARETALDAGVVGLRRLHPYALVVNITPWNFPFSLGWLDTVPALLAGAAVIVKPSEVAPRFAGPLQAAIDEVTELAGVVRFIPGDAAVGEALIDQADFVCFTGSTATGRRVGLRAAARMIPCCLELGGKDAMIVLDDADLEAAARTAVTAATLATGQICTSLERVYVQRAVHDAFLQRCVALAEAEVLNLDDPAGPGLGPFILARQAEVFRQQIDDAVGRGAVLHTGGRLIERGGVWAPPAVLSRVDHEMLIMREETFGPALPIMVFDADDEAVRLGNDCRYGLSAVVFSRRPARAMGIARRLHAGSVAINGWDARRAFPAMPHDAFGLSGLGPSRGGWENITRFTRRTVLARFPTAGPDRG